MIEYTQNLKIGTEITIKGQGYNGTVKEYDINGVMIVSWHKWRNEDMVTCEFDDSKFIVLSVPEPEPEQTKENKNMVTIRYTTHTVKNSPELDELAFCCELQDEESLKAIQEKLGDDTITAAIFDTSNGDYDNLHVGYGYPSFQKRNTWEKVIEYHNDDEYLENELPHGAGIDDEWAFQRVGKRVICSNSYHVMTNGMYDGWIDFKVYVTPRKPEMNANFRVDSVTLSQRSFWVCDDEGNEYNDIIGIREYLNDSFERFI